MNIKNVLKSSVAVAALFAVAAPAHAGSVSNGNDTASVTLSGYFNKAVLYMNDGEAARVSFVDNSNARTRARIIAKGKINEALNFGAVSEYSMGRNASSTVSPGDPDAGANPGSGTHNAFDIRHTYVKLDHKSLGGLTLGWSSGATDGLTEKSHAGTGDAAYTGTVTTGAGIHLRTSTAASSAPASSTTIGAMDVSGVEGTRQGQLRYQTPNFGGFSAATSVHNDGDVAAALNFGGKFAGFKIDAGYGYWNQTQSSSTVEDAHGGSIAISHDSGFNVSGLYTAQEYLDTTRKDGKRYGAAIGYSANLTSMGATHFVFDWSLHENAAANDDKMHAYQIGVTQDTDAGVKFYIGAMSVDAEKANNVDYDNVTTVLAGTKVYF